MKLNSLKFKMSILHTSVLGGILIFFSIVLYFISNNFFQQIDYQLKIKAEAIDFTIKVYQGVLGEEDPDTLSKAVRKTITMKSEWLLSGRVKKVSDNWVKESEKLSLDRDYINVLSADKKVQISSSNLNPQLLALFMDDLHLPKGGRSAFKTVSYNHKNIRLITYPLEDPKGQYFIQVGASQDVTMQLLLNWVYSIVITFPLILLLTNFVGRKQADRILQPVNEITQMVNTITHRDLSARIKPKNFDSEMTSLIESFNDMIARLEKSFNHIEEFSHHVAHELKTPLTIIKGEADLLLRKERSKHEYQQALRIILEEAERVLRTIEDLLLLSKLDYQPEALKYENFDFVEFFSEICEQARILATPKGVGILMRVTQLKPSLMVNGDKLHLRRLFFNIIDNAIAATPAPGQVSIELLNPESDKIMITISDAGRGIPPENLEKIFEKFFSTTGESGLGLSIASTIAKIHNGAILVENNENRGATFKIILPAL